MAINKKRILFLALIMLLFAAVLVSYLFSTSDYLGSRQVDRLIARADENEERASKIVKRLTKVMAFDVVDDPRAAKRKYLEANTEIGEARNELEAAIDRMHDIKDLKVPMWQKNYADLRTESLTSQIKMINSLERWFSKMEFVADFLRRTTSAEQKFKYGLGKINESIEDSNNQNYDRAKSEASKGKQLFDESQTLLQEADKMERNAGLASVLAIVSEAQDFASLTIQLAEAGATGRIDEYNEIVQESEDAKTEVIKEWEPEVIKEPRKWYSRKTKALEKSIDNYMEEALDLKESADKLYEKNIK